MAKPQLTDILNIEHPVIMAPMFLISNAAMVKEALDSGITGCIPALNYRTIPELRAAIQEITSLGSPKKTIELSKPKGIKVFCDVINVEMAKKCEGLGADAIIAVNSEAGGHSGKIAGRDLIPLINEAVKIPVISAGGVATYSQMKERLDWGAAGCSVGTIFIASDEAPVSDGYKQACVDYGAKDIIHTTKLSGTPCTVINTPYVQKVGTKQNLLEKLMHSNRFFKKYIKMFISWRGIGNLKKAAFSTTYKTVWCAGPTIEDVHAVRPVKEIVASLVKA